MNALIFINAVIIGAIIMSLEILCGRMIAPLFGSGLTTWAIVIAVTLLSMTAGYFYGGWQADKKPYPRILFRNLSAAAIYLFCLNIFLSNWLKALIDINLSLEAGAMLFSLFNLFVPIFFLSTFFPIATRLLLNDLNKTGKISGTIYGLSTIGSIFGTLVTALILIPQFYTQSLILMNGLACLISACFFLFFDRPAAQRRLIFF